MQYYVEQSYIDLCWKKCKDYIVTFNFPDKWRFNEVYNTSRYFSYQLNIGMICIFPEEELITHSVSKTRGNLYVEFSSFDKDLFKDQVCKNHPELDWPEKQKFIFQSQ